MRSLSPGFHGSGIKAGLAGSFTPEALTRVQSRKMGRIKHSSQSGTGEGSAVSSCGLGQDSVNLQPVEL